MSEDFQNSLYYGDNLNVLRDKEQFPDNSIDLIYLDPPFNSKVSYNILYKEPSGTHSKAQITAFDDAWSWGEEAEREFDEILHQSNTLVSEMMNSIRKFLSENDMMAYLTMMANRLLELHRVLKPTGSLYLHCDPTASHYLKILLDCVFGKEFYANEIIWKRAETVKGNFGQGRRQFDTNTDSIFFYKKSASNTFIPQFKAYTKDYIENFYKYTETKTGRRYQLISMTGPGGAAKGNPQYEVMGVTRYWRYSKKKMQELIDTGLVIQTKPGAVPRKKQYLDTGKGVSIQSLWDDIPALHATDSERLGYPTQKPLTLLERIIKSSSKEGDIILDPFCGCGTAVHAAQILNRKWIGIDITHLAISLIEKRLNDAFPDITYEVHGTPKDFEGANDLAKRDKYQFQWWACSLVNSQPYQGKKKGADSGIDGLIFFQDESSGAKKIIVSVKGGVNVNVGMIRELVGTVKREKAEIGLFVTLTVPTRPMAKEAVSAGFYESPNYGKFPKIQILTINDLLGGKVQPQYPAKVHGQITFKKAKVERKKAHQPDLL